jgi:hypothetical protein
MTDFKGDRLFQFAWSNTGDQLIYRRDIVNSDVLLPSGLD